MPRAAAPAGRLNQDNVRAHIRQQAAREGGCAAAYTKFYDAEMPQRRFVVVLHDAKCATRGGAVTTVRSETMRRSGVSFRERETNQGS